MISTRHYAQGRRIEPSENDTEKNISAWYCSVMITVQPQVPQNNRKCRKKNRSYLK